ncbi:flagellar basal body rod protein FlgC [Rheinheimera muenzenbergensis]|uniref:Flagellar basal-body rod protein FlgC n=1 Tax=Rheinheimera muenzenbergensis TaxID=1193628 RepID=A0ABU8C223_9GAMM|nr:flagellar basal body rod protein FlgC [Gammaproteobacteria bacterium]MBU1556151.1 flagellar basal body rod protein FlgC [Gammaproteobacteria bacterium]MBU2069355.1 flagellar basal body rod protein FlgC [Gammaproteobacteria bacterium]MBU2183408.1 flagellar basal body rod protein FlgC [Gammaproteobacteria bacterium]MBU2204565.1 flagellar basal body rod protein FlgC [Gammaproteobacteria bacterium]
MGAFNIFDITGSGMTAQSLRMNTTASNIANANSVSSSVEQTYRGRHPVFAAELSQAKRMQGDASVGVKVLGIVESDAPLNVEYAPNHPLADDNGYIYKPNINIMEEMANMISASRSYETNVQTADAAKQMVMRTLRLGQQG